jgi:very-short-patch-repair endonuclease
MACSGKNSPPPGGEGSGVGGSLRHTDDPSFRTRRIGGPVHTGLARRLRNEPTVWERRLWAWLRTLRRDHGLHFRREVPIGRYIADFGCHAAKLIIELDGPFHEPARDADRDAWFERAGYRTLRFANEDVTRQWDRVVAAIEHALRIGDRLEGPLASLQPFPSPLRGGARGGGLLQPSRPPSLTPADEAASRAPHPQPLPSRGRGG